MKKWKIERILDKFGGEPGTCNLAVRHSDHWATGIPWKYIIKVFFSKNILYIKEIFVKLKEWSILKLLYEKKTFFHYQFCYLKLISAWTTLENPLFCMIEACVIFFMHSNTLMWLKKSGKFIIRGFKLFICLRKTFLKLKAQLNPLTTFPYSFSHCQKINVLIHFQRVSFIRKNNAIVYKVSNFTYNFKFKLISIL